MKFAETYLSEDTYISVNGYFPSLNIKTVGCLQAAERTKGESCSCGEQHMCECRRVRVCGYFIPSFFASAEGWLYFELISPLSPTPHPSPSSNVGVVQHFQ